MARLARRVPIRREWISSGPSSADRALVLHRTSGMPPLREYWPMFKDAVAAWMDD